jgi:hypothetical protein
MATPRFSQPLLVLLLSLLLLFSSRPVSAQENACAIGTHHYVPTLVKPESFLALRLYLRLENAGIATGSSFQF